MPKGLTATSEQIVVSFALTETAINTFTSERVDLQLNALDSEVFVVTGVKLDLEPCDARLGGGARIRTASFASISKQDVTGSNLGSGLGNPSVIATAATTFECVDTLAPNLNATQLFHNENSIDTPSQLDYVDIIATPDFFVNVQGSDNIDAKSVQGKLYGYRAKASSAVYASLVQSELLSS
jgi:hypothetical protein